MNIKEIIDGARSLVLDDTLVPYLWSDLDLITCLNRAYQELCRESKCLIDSTTSSVCRINILANQSMHALSPFVVFILNARRNSDSYPMKRKTEHYMENYSVTWKTTTGTPMWLIIDTAPNYVSVYPKFDTTGYIAGSDDINFVAASKTITKAGATFTSHYSIGQTLVVSGTTLNNGTYTITNVAATTITVSETVVNENLTNAILQSVRDVALLRVARLPLVKWTTNDLALGTPPTPEINATYHEGLMDGIGKYAFLKPDTEIFDPQRSKDYAAKFEVFKSDVMLDIANLMLDTELQCTPHLGAI